MTVWVGGFFLAASLIRRRFSLVSEYWLTLDGPLNRFAIVSRSPVICLFQGSSC